MARQFRWALAVIATVAAIGVPADASPQAEAPPPPPQQQTQQPQQARDGRRDGDRRPWWKDPEFMTEVGITADQSAAIDAIWRSEYEKMKPLRLAINDLEPALNKILKAKTADVSVVAQQVDVIEHKRAELTKLRVVMLYRMHRVLNPDQNVKFQAAYERREAARRKQDGDRRH